MPAELIAVPKSNRQSWRSASEKWNAGRRDDAVDAGAVDVVEAERVDAGRTIRTTFGYDAVGYRTSFVDGRQNATTYTYTPWGLPESTIEPGNAARRAIEQGAEVNRKGSDG